MSSQFQHYMYNFYIGGIVNWNHSSEFIAGFPINSVNQITDSVELTLFVTTMELGPVPFVVETLLGFEYTGTATKLTQQL